MIRIGVLRVMEFNDAMRSVHGPYSTVMELFFEQQPVELLDIPLHEGKTPASLDDCDGWVVNGSPRSTYEDFDWIRTGEQIVRAAYAGEHPLIGICFGHQLIAQALGGRVEKAAGGWGLGARQYSTEKTLPCLSELGETTLLASHQDQVVELPADATVWSSAAYCPIAGYTVGERILTVQAHPEYTLPLATALYNSRRQLFGDEAVDTALATLAAPLSNAAIAEATVRLITG